MTLPRNVTNTRSRPALWKRAAVALLLTCASMVNAMAQQEPEYDEIGVFLMIQGVGGFEMNAVYMDDKLYLPVGELFGFLKINHELSKNYDSVSGFFLKEQNRYLISHTGQAATVGNEKYPLDKTSLLRTANGLYMRNDVFGRIFGLYLSFNFRSMSIELKTHHELPVIKELRLAVMRKNVSRLKGEVTVDTTLKRQYHPARGGMVDWSVISSQSEGGRSDTRASLGLGAELLGGETNIMLNYSSRTGFEERQQYYRWRWANNDARVVKQVAAGKIQPRSISSIYAPVIGVTATNTPTSFRKSFGSYLLSDYTEPGWTVELFINNVIVDFTTADASGFFSFEVPLVYGISEITLKFYGPWGEERVREQTLNIPYNFLPKGTMEYNVSSGIVRDTSNALYTRTEAGVGLHRNLTVGGGIEYLSSIKSGSSIPFLNTSLRFLNNFMFTGEYAHGVRTRGLLNYRLPSSLVFELDYIHYTPGQKAISFNYLEERKASLSMPVRLGTFRSFARVGFRQNVLEQLTFSSAEVLLSSYFGKVNANISGFATWITKGSPYIYSNLSLGFRMGRNTNFRPQAQVDITNKKLVSVKAELEHTFSQKAHLSLIYEENIRSVYRSVELAFRYDLSFAQTSASARIANKRLYTTESARGGFAFGSGNGAVLADNRSKVGRGGITVEPFLDVNHNGKRDTGEDAIEGLNVRINGGRLLIDRGDTLIRIIELEPFTSYLLEIDDNTLENVAWQIEDKKLSVYADPNQFKRVSIPVKVMGEVNGMVYLKDGAQEKGLGRIIINITGSAGKTAGRVLSEQDGFYAFLGLAPGRYTASVDSLQLSRLGFISNPPDIEFEIAPYKYGDIADDISFTLTSALPFPAGEESGAAGHIPDDEDLAVSPDVTVSQTDNIPLISEPEKISVRQDSAQPAEASAEPQPEVIEGNINLSAGVFYVQCGAFTNPDSAKKLKMKVCSLTEAPCGIIREKGFYKVRLGYFHTRQDAAREAEILNSKGIAAQTGKSVIR